MADDANGESKALFVSTDSTLPMYRAPSNMQRVMTSATLSDASLMTLEERVAQRGG